MRSQIPVACNLDCGGGCALLADVEDGRLTRIIDNPAGGPYMVGCVRGYQMARVLYAPDRLRRPLLRSGPRGSGPFREVEWNEALDYTAEKLRALRDRHGAVSILNLSSAGSCRGALHNTLELSARFFSLFGGCTEWRGSYSSQAVYFVVPYVLGTIRTGIDPATLESSKLIILWGANVVDCRHGGETYARIREAKLRGVEVVVIDPRRSATVENLATRWIAARPGTDSALMLSVLYVLFTEGLVDFGYAARYCSGTEALERYLLGDSDGQAKTPQWAEAACGTPAGQIVELARLYGRTRPTALLPGLSIQRTLGGEEASRLAIVLQAVTGNLGVRGNCVLFSNRAVSPLGGARNDYDIFLALADRLGFGDRFSEGKDEEAWLRAFVSASDVPDYDEFRRSGVYMGRDRCRTAFTDFIADPAAHPLGTPSGRIELLSTAYAADTGFPALPEYRPLLGNPEYPLQLITPKSRYRVHSQNANIAWFNEREPQALWMHPSDAAARGVVAGQKVLITSPQGAVRIAVRVTEDIMRGVVCLLEGMWPAFASGVAGDAAVEIAGSANVLTSTEPTLPSHGSRTHSVWVQVAPA